MYEKMRFSWFFVLFSVLLISSPRSLFTKYLKPLGWWKSTAKIAAVATSPKSTIEATKEPRILFDVDKVICKRSGQSDAKLSFDLFWNPKKSARSNIRFLANITANMRHLLYQGKDGLGERCINLAKEHNPKTVHYILDKINGPKKPIAGTVAIIQKLHDANIPLYIGTNMGATVFEDQTKRPGFEFFETCFDLTRSQHVTIKGLEKNICKPHTNFFTEWTTRNSFDPNKMIFVDDKQDNVDAAKKAGMTGIRYHYEKGEAKATEQLKKDLHNVLHTQFDLNLFDTCTCSTQSAPAPAQTTR